MASYTNKFVYDGWNLIAILDSQSTILVSFTWGTDLSGSMQRAGGVGGLISMKIYSGANAGTYFACYDGNGNVEAMANAATGATAGTWEYDPFGCIIRATGPLAFANPFLFSTKYYDWETGFYYYGYRYYNPSTGRWLSGDPINEEGFKCYHNPSRRRPLSRDTIQEKGGPNLYGFVGNAAVNAVDFFGLFYVDKSTKTIKLNRCEIVRLYGHGSHSNPWKWTYFEKNKDWLAGAAVTCWPNENMSGLDDSMKLWTTWGGEPLEEDWEKIMWGLSATGDDFYNPGGSGPTAGGSGKMANGVKASRCSRQSRNGQAPKLMDTKGCPCHGIGIHFVELNKHGEVVDPPESFDGIPPQTDTTYVP